VENAYSSGFGNNEREAEEEVLKTAKQRDVVVVMRDGSSGRVKDD